MSNPNESQDLGTKKEKKQIRYSRYSAYLYLAMALMIVGVATASIFALNRSVETLPEYSTPTFSFLLGCRILVVSLQGKRAKESCGVGGWFLYL